MSQVPLNGKCDSISRKRGKGKKRSNFKIYPLFYETEARSVLVCETQPCPERLRLGQQLFCFLLCVNTFAALHTRLWGFPLDNKLESKYWTIWGDWWGMLCTHPGYVISNLKGSNCFHMLAHWGSWCRASCLAVIRQQHLSVMEDYTLEEGC